MDIRYLIAESIDNLVKAHTECAEAGIPLPDKDLKNLRQLHDGWAYDKLNGHYVEHRFNNGETGQGWITHRNDIHMPHNLDGPAIIHANGDRDWYTHGIEQGAHYKASPSHDEQFWWGMRKVNKDTFKRQFKGVD